MPTPVLAAAISRKVRSLNEPTKISSTPSTTKIRLKYVKTFPFTISFTVRVWVSTWILLSPASVLAFTSLAVSPCMLSVS